MTQGESKGREEREKKRGEIKNDRPLLARTSHPKRESACEKERERVGFVCVWGERDTNCHQNVSHQSTSE